MDEIDMKLCERLGLVLLVLLVLSLVSSLGIRIIPIRLASASTSQLHTVGTKIYDSSGNEIVLNGMDTRAFMGYYYPPTYTDDKVYVTPNDVDVIASHGINFIRLDIALDQAVRHQPMGTPTALNYWPTFWNSLDAVVFECWNKGVYVALDYAVTDGGFAPLGGGWGVGCGFPAWMYDGSWTYNKAYPTTVDGKNKAMYDFFNTADSTANNVRLAYQTFWVDLAKRYRSYPNVIFILFNEPMCNSGTVITTEAEWKNFMAMYKVFMENTIDKIRSADGGVHLIDCNVLWGWYLSDTPKIDRLNVIVDCHSYTNTNINSTIHGLIQLAWRYNQPFILGEYGGVEEGLQSRSSFLTTMLVCNHYGVSRSYLRFDYSPRPSAQTWKDLEDYQYGKNPSSPPPTGSFGLIVEWINAVVSMLASGFQKLNLTSNQLLILLAMGVIMYVMLNRK